MVKNGKRKNGLEIEKKGKMVKNEKKGKNGLEIERKGKNG